MFLTIDSVQTAHKVVLAAAADFYLAKSAKFKDPIHWNSPDQFEFRDRLKKLEGAEAALGLTPEEVNEGRRSVGLPEEDRILSVV